MASSTAGLFQVEAFLKPHLRFAKTADGSFGRRETFHVAGLGSLEVEQDLAADRVHFLAA